MFIVLFAKKKKEILLFTFVNCFGFGDDCGWFGAKCITFGPQQAGQLGFPFLYRVVLIKTCVDDTSQQISSSFYTQNKIKKFHIMFHGKHKLQNTKTLLHRHSSVAVLYSQLYNEQTPIGD